MREEAVRDCKQNHDEKDILVRTVLYRTAWIYPPSSMRLLCFGLGRTGTASLRIALTELSISLSRVLNGGEPS